MTDHPQTATERFLRHGVAGGYTIHGHVLLFDDEQGFGYETPCEIDGMMFIRIDIAEMLLDPALWRAAGRSLGWDDIATNPKNVSWLEHWHRLIDHLASHPGDVDGYLEKIIETKH